VFLNGMERYFFKVSLSFTIVIDMMEMEVISIYFQYLVHLFVSHFSSIEFEFNRDHLNTMSLE